MSFYLFRFSLISVDNILQCSVYKSCNSFVKFIPEYFILFDDTVNGIVSLISFSGCLSLMYRSIIAFCADLIAGILTELVY